MHRKGLFTGLTGAWLNSLRTEPCLIYLLSIETQCEKVEGGGRGEAEGRKRGRKKKRKEEMNKSSKDIRGKFIDSCIRPSIHSFNEYLLNSYQAHSRH